MTRRQFRGAEVFATELADVLARRGHDVWVVGIQPPPDPALTPSRATAVDVSLPAAGALSIRALVRLVRILRRLRPDVVQANGGITLKYASLAARLPGRRWPLVYRNISVASGWVRGGLHRLWVRWLLRPVSRVASVSEQSREDFIATYGFPPARIETVYRGIPLPREVDRDRGRARLRRLLGIDAAATVIATAGNLSVEKNPIGLLRAISPVLRSRPSCHLVVFGDGVLRPELEREVARHGLGGRVHLTGTRTDLAELVGGSDLFVLFSRIEGIPGAALEAAAQEVPVVCTNVGGVPEAFEDGVSARLVPSGDEPGLTAAVERLLDDPAERRRLGRAGRASVQSRFDLERSGSRFEAIYRSVLPEAQPGRIGRRGADASRGVGR